VRILTLALGVPFPPIGGGLTRTFHLLKALAAAHDVTLAAFTYGEAHEAPPYPVRLETVSWEWSRAYQEMTGEDVEAARRAYERLTYVDPNPWFASVMDPVAMEEKLAGLVGAAPPDLVLLEGTPLARFIPSLPADVPCVLDLFDVHSVMAERALDGAAPADRPAASREAERTLAFERRAVSRCAACLAVSEEDAVAARVLLGAGAVHVVPNGVDTSYFVPSPGPAERGALLFTGRLSYAPNADAALYFARDVLPLVQRECADVRFHIVGADPPAEVSALGSAAVIVHGRVDDVRPHFQAAEVVVVPVRAGGGTRLKVLEAAASAKAIVTTPLGAEGLAFKDGRDLLVADSAPAFAAAVVTLLRDPARREALGASARTAVGQYDWTAVGEVFRTGLDSLFPRR
jgi:glycosyltransferase involved in cell wall biosynthesis